MCFIVVNFEFYSNIPTLHILVVVATPYTHRPRDCCFNIRPELFVLTEQLNNLIILGFSSVPMKGRLEI